MSRLEIPLQATTLWYTGEAVLRAHLDLLLKDAAGGWHKETFRVDTGTDMTWLSAARAKALGLPMPQRGWTVPLTTSAGAVSVILRSGFLRLRVDGMGPVEHVLPCPFLGDPDAPPPPGALVATFPRSLLGLTGVVDNLRFIFDGAPAPGAPYGNLIVEKR
jgi:hypothetical protein